MQFMKKLIADDLVSELPSVNLECLGRAFSLILVVQRLLEVTLD